MDPIIWLMAGGTMLVLSICAGYALGWANRAFHVEVDPRIEAVLAALPGANCGGCGYVGCASYAEAVVAAGAPPDKCPVGGASCAEQVARIVGVDLKPSWPQRPVVHCRATYEQRLGRGDYRGERTCAAANLVAGVQGCTYGCLGFGDCRAACAFGAIRIVSGLATIDYERCTGCGACARVCPRNIITMVPFKRERMLVVGCSNKDMGKDVKAVCKIGCIGCKACQKASPLFKVTDNIPTIDYENYDPEHMESALIAVEKCPVKGLIFVGRPPRSDRGTGEETGLVTADFRTTVDDSEWHG